MQVNSAIQRLSGLVVRYAALFLICGGSFGLAKAASISYIELQKGVDLVQVGNGNALTPGSAYFSSYLGSSVANAYTTVTLTYPGAGSPQNLPQVNPYEYGFYTFFPTQAAMDTAYPFGAYTFTGDGTDSASFPYLADGYTSMPYLAGTDYTDLQGMDPSQPFTFNFSPFVAGAGSDGSGIGFNIFDYTQGIVVYNNPLPLTTTSVTIPANTLAGGDLFSYQLLFFSFDDSLTTGGVSTHFEFDMDTSGTFTTASSTAPEPSTIVLSGLALLGATAFSAFRQKWKATKP